MRESDLADVREPTMAATQFAAGGQAGVASSATSAGNADVLQSEIHALDVRLRAVRGGASTAAHAGGAQRTEADRADACHNARTRKPPGSTRSSRLREEMQRVRGAQRGAGVSREHLEGSKLSQKRRLTKRDLGHGSGGEARAARAHGNPTGVEMGAGSPTGEHRCNLVSGGGGGAVGEVDIEGFCAEYSSGCGVVHLVSVPGAGAGGDAVTDAGAGLDWQQDSAFVDALRDFELSISALTARHV